MKSKFLIATSIFTLSMLYGCLDEVTEAPDMSGFACSTEPLDDDSGVKIICGGDSVGVVLNGKNGKDGKNGKNGDDGKDGKDGKNGSSCTVTENKDINGYDIICNNEKVGELKNGEKGDAGKSCTIKENKKKDGYDITCDGQTVTVTNGKSIKGESCQGEQLANGNVKITCGSDFEAELAKGKDGASCTVTENKKEDGYDLECGDKVVTIKNGKSTNGESCQGEQLANGNVKITCGSDFEAELPKGKDGASCTVTENKKEDGYDLDCGGDVVTVKNGKSIKGESCQGEQLANGNIKISCGSDFEAELAKGNDGASCTVTENKKEDGYDLNCGGNVVTIKNGKDAVPPSSSSAASSSSVAPSSSSVKQLSAECKALRSKTDEFSPIYDVFDCLRPNEKVAFILRHASRPSNKWGDKDPLDKTGEQQCATVGNAFKEMNVDDFAYMHTYYYRAKQTAWIIAQNKGQDVGSENEWFGDNDNEFQTTNNDLLDSVFVNDANKRNACDNGWAGYARAAYGQFDENEYKNGENDYQYDSRKTACKEAFRNIDSMVTVLVERHFTYDKMKPITLAISHDQFLTPFVISISNRKIKGEDGRDFRYHRTSNNKHWINYLSGVAIIVDDDNNTKIIPVSALGSGFLE